MLKPLALFVCLAFATTAARTEGTPAANALQPSDIFEIEVANDPQISPDGSRIVYVRGGFDIMTDRSTAALWVIDTSTGQQRPLGTRSRRSTSPRWSPDGSKIAYVGRDDDGRAQIFLHWLDTGQSASLSHLQYGPSGLSWSPDGTRIAFAMFVPEAVEPFATMPPKPEGADWAPPARVPSTGCSTAPTARAFSTKVSPTCSCYRSTAARRASSPAALTTTPGRCPGDPTAAASSSPPTGERTGNTTAATPRSTNSSSKPGASVPSPTARGPMVVRSYHRTADGWRISDSTTGSRATRSPTSTSPTATGHRAISPPTSTAVSASRTGEATASGSSCRSTDEGQRQDRFRQPGRRRRGRGRRSGGRGDDRAPLRRRDLRHGPGRHRRLHPDPARTSSRYRLDRA